MGTRPAPEPPAGSVAARVPWELEAAGRGGADGERGQTTPDVAAEPMQGLRLRQQLAHITQGERPQPAE